MSYLQNDQYHFLKCTDISNIQNVKNISSKDSKNLLIIFTFAQFHVQFLLKVLQIIKRRYQNINYLEKDPDFNFDLEPIFRRNYRVINVLAYRIYVSDSSSW